MAADRVLAVTPQYLRTRARIRDAALRVMADKGVDGTSISDLASAAGVSRGTIYNYFPNVREVMRHIAAEISTEFSEAVDAANAPITDPAQRIANGMRQHFVRAARQPDWGRFMARFANSEETLRDNVQQHLFRDLSAGVQSGRFTLQADRMLALAVVIGGSTTTMMQAIVDKMLPDGTGEQVVELILRQLGVPVDEAHDIARAPLPSLDLTRERILRLDTTRSDTGGKA